MRSTARTALGPKRAPGRLVTPRSMRHTDQGHVEPAEVRLVGRVLAQGGAKERRYAFVGLGPSIGSREDRLDRLS